MGLERRPYYLEEIDRLQKLWEAIAGENRLTSTQLHALWQTLLEKWQDWRLDKGNRAARHVWPEFCREVLLNAGWPREQGPGSKLLEELEDIADAAGAGMLFDVFELFLTILKESPRRG